ncbi:MAG: hypothetical protein NTV58_01085 [Deltaproteobacteria bacterium]|nr:hypothetical protein [Deltaproteobacteria bacterium]
MALLKIIGLLFGILGAAIAVRGELTTTAAQINYFWDDLEKSWEKQKPTYFHKITCLIAKTFGSKNVLDTQSSTVEKFRARFWGFVLLFIGFLFQLIAMLLEQGIMRFQCAG